MTIDDMDAMTDKRIITLQNRIREGHPFLAPLARRKLREFHMEYRMRQHGVGPDEQPVDTDWIRKSKKRSPMFGRPKPVDIEPVRGPRTDSQQR